MKTAGMLLGYFPTYAAAVEALAAMRRARLPRAGLVHKQPDGSLVMDDVPRSLLSLPALVYSAACFGLLVYFLPTDTRSWIQIVAWMALSLLVGGGLAALFGRRVLGLYGLVIPRKVLLQQAGRLVAGETVVVQMAAPAEMVQAINILRKAGREQPSIFAFHTRPEEGKIPPHRAPAEFLRPMRVKEHARSLAESHVIEPPADRGTPLLKNLERWSGIIDGVYSTLSDASHLEQGITTSAEWILDNTFIIRGHIEDIRKNLPGRFYSELPVLRSGGRRGQPRIYDVARELVIHAGGQIHRHNLLDFLYAYQSISELTTGELWALPLMMRIALVADLAQLVKTVEVRMREREMADYWANRLMAAMRRQPDSIFPLLSELTREVESPSMNFALQLTEHLYDVKTVLDPLTGWLSRKLGPNLDGAMMEERGLQAADETAIGNAISSLRWLKQIDWREIFELQSRLDEVLRKDPARVFRSMDFATRDRYRHAVEDLARVSGRPETEVAEVAVALAAGAGEGADDRLRHVGYYLVDEGRRRLCRELDCRDSRRHRFLWAVRSRGALLYLGSVAAITAAFMAVPAVTAIMARVPLPAAIFLLVTALFPCSQLAVEMVNYLVTRLLPPWPMPRMSYERRGIPDNCRTLVVVPVMLTSRKNIREDLEQLEIRYQANPDPNLIYSLFYDFTDSSSETEDGDAALLKTAEEGVLKLDERYGPHRFYLFCREREWAPSEGIYMGWERKRGKLEDLNRLINGQPARGGRDIVKVGDSGRLAEVRYVITLDSDTQLPRDTARRLVETISHPLNQPRYDEAERVVSGGYTIIQPRVSTSLPSATATRFSRLLTDPVGVDPYTTAVSDVYQDLLGEGSYHGKGIYDPRMFHKVLGGRFPDSRLLSHDLIEGAYVGVGLASDVELFDEFPRDYNSYCARLHRWVRGDWQIGRWCLPSVPGRGGRDEKNPLSAMNRWKIADNLRRSLTPGASFLFLLTAVGHSTPVAVQATVLVAAQVFAGPLLTCLTWLTTLHGRRAVLRTLPHDVTRSIVQLCIMVHQAGLAGDAIVRVLYRLLVSRRNLLVWTTARDEERSRGAGKQRTLAWQVAASFTLVAAVFAVTVERGYTGARSASPVLAAWLLAPLALWLLTRPRLQRPFQLSPAAVRKLRLLARRTWRLFDDYVDAASNHLPTDNYQVSHVDELAPRTSPTNIGLYLLSTLAAADMGFLPATDALARIGQTVRTIEHLEKYGGHLLNWYDTGTLEPLRPRYVSTVDSGNLLACLWTLKAGIGELVDAPLLGPEAVSGTRDTALIAVAAMEKAGVPREIVAEARILAGELESNREKAAEVAALLRRCETISARLNAVMIKSWVEAEKQERPGIIGERDPMQEAAYWTDQVHRSILRWLRVADNFLNGVEEAPGRNGKPPSLRRLARGEKAPSAGSEVAQPAMWQAMEALGEAQETLDIIDKLAGGMDFRFLYHRKRRLFHIGYNLTDQRLDNSFYDLLASEARLASLAAVAKGDVPARHWYALGRPFSAIRGHSVLLSWSGSMFEYLMPLLLTRTFPNSLLDMACREAVRLQVRYGTDRGHPWGISESAYADLDAGRVYQYKGFGVPGLGMKRGLEDDLVVAPYATVMALMVDPRSAVANLDRLAREGLYGDFGFYEAVDYSRKRAPKGASGVVVKTFMAHHQGMALLALVSLLADMPMQRRFHSDVRIKATEPLLYERIPAVPPVFSMPDRTQAPSAAMPADILPTESKFDTPHTRTPKTQLLSNGDYSIMVTAAGGGYSRWRDLDITRWRPDSTRDNWGSWCYLRNVDTGLTWSSGYHPVGGDMDNYVAIFTQDRAQIRRSDAGLETETEIIVSPEDNAEIRRVTVTNRTGRARELEAITFAELALCPHAADLMHPAFQKLFVQTEHLPGMDALLATRRVTDPEGEQVWAGHRLVFEGGEDHPTLFETDRAAFLGRNGSYAEPAALRHPAPGSTGYVLDPIFSLRRRFRLDSGQRLSFSAVLCADESRDRVSRTLDKFGDPRNILRELELTWRQAQLELRHLRIQPEEARRYQQLASHMLYPNPILRSTEERVAANRLGQSSLWAYGISGDLPVIAVTVADASDISLVAQVLQAHTYWRRHGLVSDLVVLNEESTSYEQPLHTQLQRLIASKTSYTGMEQPGGVYLRTVDQIPPEDLNLIFSVARVVLVAARGTLPQQLSAPARTRELPAKQIEVRPSETEPVSALPAQDLSFYNGYGGVSTEDDEYIIDLEPGKTTPAPWVNVLANRNFGALCSEAGIGPTWYGNSQRNRLTSWTNDPVTDPPSETIYIRDEMSGRFWTATPQPVRQDIHYRVRHGAGYTVYEHNNNGLRHRLTLFVPKGPDEDDPVKLQRLSLTNETGRTRHLSVTYYADWVLGEERERSQMAVVTRWDGNARTMMAFNHYHSEYSARVAFAAVSPLPDSCTADRTEFLGRNGTPEDPAAMGRVSLSGRTGALLDPCFAIQSLVTLEPGETADVTCLMGQCEGTSEARRLVGNYIHSAQANEAFKGTRRYWQRLLGRVAVRTPEPAVDVMVNSWLPYQSLACRLWGRSAFYQSGGAYGFRDQLQDVVSMLILDPSLAREHIVTAAAHQFREGDVQHWWHPPSQAGIRSRCSDDLLWLPWAVAAYLEHTGDEDLLDRRVPFLEGEPLEEEDVEVFSVPRRSLEEGTVYEHCRRAIERGCTSGNHGLPLMGSGDWNDGMNRVGADGQGESVWLAWFLMSVLKDFAAVARRYGREEDAVRWETRARNYADAVEEHAWDGQWYRRAFFGDGTPIGAASCEEAAIDSISQSWAVMSGAADPQRAREAVESAWERLVLRDREMGLLLAPPFNRSPKDPGYIMEYPPGVRENGGQYTHAAAWLARALAAAGQGDRAASLLQMISPLAHSSDREGADRYRTEPYAVAADIYLLEGREGQGGWTWYTGAAGWIYRVWIEDVLGLKVRGSYMEVEPSIPPDWERFTLQYRRGRAEYLVEVENPDGVGRGVARVELDGRVMGDGRIPLVKDDPMADPSVRHHVKVVMGSGS